VTKQNVLLVWTSAYEDVWSENISIQKQSPVQKKQENEV